MKTTVSAPTTTTQNIVFVPLDKTIDNLDQAGTIDNEKMLEIAESLQRNRDNGFRGLLQVPVARLNPDGCYELAFGRHRRAAFFYLSLKDEFFKEMPLIVRDLDNLAMFEALATENFKRRDINPVEAAEIIHAYMSKYGKTSAEAAQFFGKTEEYIRGTVRLLGLPEPAKDLLRAGEMTVTTARSVLAVQKVADQDAMDTLVEDLKNKQFPAEEAIQDALSASTQEMIAARPWLENKEFPNKYLTPLQKKDVALLLDVDSADKTRKVLLDEMMRLIAGGMEIDSRQFPGFSADQLEKVRILVNPPACTNCATHVQFDGSHFCGLRLCYERKVKAWEQARIHKLSKDLGIDLYVNEQTDGKAVELYRYIDADMKLFKERHADLRLRPTNRTIWNNFPEVPGNVLVVAVRKTAEKRLKADQEKAGGSPKANSEEAKKAEEQARIQMGTHDLRNEAIQRFEWNVVVPAFSSLMDGVVNLAFGLCLCDNVLGSTGWPQMPQGVDDVGDQLEQIRDTKKKAEGLKQLRQLMVFALIDQEVCEDAVNYDRVIKGKKPLIALSEEFQSIAAEWGVKLTKDFAKQAEKYQAEFDEAVKELSKK